MFTLEECEEFYELWKEAYNQVVLGYDYKISIGGDTQELTRNSMSKIKAEMLYWKNKIDELKTGIKTSYVNAGCNF